MALNIIKQITAFGHRPLVHQTIRRFCSLYEPDYLETGKSKIPLHPTLNIQIKGYSYPILENYQAFVHKVTVAMDIDFDNSWAYPHQALHVNKYKYGTTVVDTEYDLNIYERNMLISDLSSTKFSVFVRILEAGLPEGVTLNIEEFVPEMEAKRYLPDKQLLELKSELVERQKK